MAEVHGVAVGCVLLLLLVVGSVPVAVAQSPSTGGPVGLTSCTTIDDPGRYVVESDIRGDTDGSCIEIAASDVVLDGDGHAVVGTGRGVGVSAAAESLTNVTVVGVTTTHWRVGVRLAGVSDSTLREVDASRNLVGVRIERSSAVTVRDGVFERNVRDGVFVVDSTEIGVRDGVIRENGAFGIDLSRVRDSTLETNDVSANRFIGVRFGRSSDNRLIDNRILGNGDVGVELHTRSRANVLGNNTIRGHAEDGLRLGGTSGTVVVGNEIRYNRHRGIALFNTDDGRFVDNLIRSNRRVGIEARNSDGVSLVGNEIAQNGRVLPPSDRSRRPPTDGLTTEDVRFDGGAVFYGSDGTRLVDNEIIDNRQRGVGLWNSRAVRLTDNRVVGNDGTGVALEHSPNGSLVGNEVRRNGYGTRDAYAYGTDGVMLYRSDGVELVGGAVAHNDGGVLLYSSDRGTVRGVEIRSEYCTHWEHDANYLYLWGSDDTTLVDNRLVNVPVWVYSADRNDVSNNTLDGCGGISLTEKYRFGPEVPFDTSDDNRIADNYLVGPTDADAPYGSVGVSVSGGRNNAVVDNVVDGHSVAVRLSDSDLDALRNATVSGNVIRNYDEGIVVRETGSGYGFVGLRIVDNVLLDGDDENEESVSEESARSDASIRRAAPKTRT